MEVENVTETSASVTESVAAPSAPSTPAPEPVSQAASEPAAAAPPAPELTLREKIQKKADAVAASRQKDPKTGQFQAKTPQVEGSPTTVNTQAPGVVSAQKPGETPAFSPNFKLKVMEQEREIPELLRPLIKDAESEKAVRELVEKAYGLEYVKPKLEQARAQLQSVSNENGTIKNQINNLVSLYKRGDIDGWLEQLGVPPERLLQWMADKINYQQLPADQKAILDARKSAEDRAWQAESTASHYQRSQEQLLTQQVQTALESVLARPDVNAIAKTYDERVGQPGAFRTRIAKDGDYIWRTTGELVSPDKLVSDYVAVLGHSGQPAPVATQAAQAATQPQHPSAISPQQQAKTPVIPNISGRSASAIPAKPIKSIDDIRAKYKEMQSAGR